MNANIKCGNRDYVETGDSHRILIINGARSDPTEWPWLAALIRMSGLYFCSATIISQNHLLTAAHCLYKEHKPLEKNDFYVSVGQYDLSSSKKEGRNFFPTRIITHEFYNDEDDIYAATSFYDIAIIYTSPIILNQKTQIICLWTGQIEREKISKSTTAGRGLTETGFASDIPLKTDVIMTKCDGVDLFPINDEDRLICGKGVDSGKGSSGVCHGDSGSGLYVQANGNWFVRGVTSAVWVNRNTRQCNTTETGTFINVAAYYGWIQEAIYATSNQCIA